MRDNIATRLFDIASIDTQIKYILHGTKDEYLLPSEMVDILYYGCKYLMTVNDFNANELLLSQKIIDCIDKLNWDEIDKNSAEDLIYHNTAWINLRNTALELLKLLGYSLDDFDEDGNLKNERKPNV